MCKVQMLRALVKQRLTAAAEEICGLFERTIAEYEEELSRSKEENERQQKLLDAVLHPQLRAVPADVQQLLLVKEEVPLEQQEWSSSLDQEDPEPPHIKEEQEKLWTSQEGEQLQGLEEADIIKFPFTPVPVKSEDDEEKPQSSQLHERQTEQMETEADGEDCGVPEPARNSDPGRHPEPDTVDKTGDSSEPETDDSCDWETREPQSSSNSLQNIKVPRSDMECNTGKTPVSSSECARTFTHKGHLQKNTGIQTGERPISCPDCGKTFAKRSKLTRHLKVHPGEKSFTCSVCKASFDIIRHLIKHMKIHTGGKPFSCSVCSKSFAREGHMRQHLLVHTGEKPFSCSICNKSFTRLHTVKIHKCVGESSIDK
ncbi:uncharacterized protein LOC141754148 [Sebastes fasciatus]|uniref:uncharacterized protein LOC141754148 n=1 Tax=Sebastes fasciatus TaxID=394691 RepID=UPI003D9DBF55